MYYIEYYVTNKMFSIVLVLLTASSEKDKYYAEHFVCHIIFYVIHFRISSLKMRQIAYSQIDNLSKEIIIVIINKYTIPTVIQLPKNTLFFCYIMPHVQYRNPWIIALFSAQKAQSAGEGAGHE